MEKLLKELDACGEAITWAKNKTWNEIYSTCHRGDWLLWLFKRTNPNDIRLLTLAKAHCANTVRHLMRDSRSIKAIDVAIAFGEGSATEEQLQEAYIAAAIATSVASTTADSAAAYVASHASTTAAYAASAAASATYSVAATAADSAAAEYAAAAAEYADSAYTTASTASAAYASRTKNQLETADICRKYLPIEIWNINE